MVYRTLALRQFTGVGYGGRPRVLFERTRRVRGTPVVPGAFWRNPRRTSLDSTTFDAPGSAANAAAFDRPRSGEIRPGPCPRVHGPALRARGTQAAIGAVFDRLGMGDRILITRLLPQFEKATLLADLALPPLDPSTSAASQGAEPRWRATDSFALSMDRALADGSYLPHLPHLNGPRGARVAVRGIEHSVDTVGQGSGERVSSASSRPITTPLNPDRSVNWSSLQPDQPACLPEASRDSERQAAWSRDRCPLTHWLKRNEAPS